MGEFLKQKILELTRRGDLEKVELIGGLRKRVMPSQLKRIQEDDKSIMRELFLPKWVSWELLKDWASDFKVEGEGRACALCGEKSRLGIDFNERFVCDYCFVKIKNLR